MTETTLEFEAWINLKYDTLHQVKKNRTSGSTCSWDQFFFTHHFIPDRLLLSIIEPGSCWLGYGTTRSAGRTGRRRESWVHISVLPRPSHTYKKKARRLIVQLFMSHILYAGMRFSKYYSHDKEDYFQNTWLTIEEKGEEKWLFWIWTHGPKISSNSIKSKFWKSFFKQVLIFYTSKFSVWIEYSTNE